MQTLHFPQKFDLLNHSGQKLLVFLRHSGCPFCKQVLSDLSRVRSEIESRDVEIVLVHMMQDAEQAEAFFARYNLDDVTSISDPDQELYKLLGVERGRLTEFLGPRVWLKGAVCTLWEGHLPGKPQGDVSQLGGVFLVEEGQVLNSYLCKNSSDRPDYVSLLEPEND